MIDSYGFGKIVINGEKYTSDVIIYPDRVDPSWCRKNGHLLSIEDLEDVLKEEPQTLIIGSGNMGLMRVSQEVRQLIEDKGIKLIVTKTMKACDEFNRIRETERVICALHLTC